MNDLKDRIDGEAPSWYDQEDDIDGYTTNYGGVQVSRKTGEIIFACVELGRNYENRPMTVKIIESEFQVLVRDNTGRGKNELASLQYPYKLKELPRLSPMEVLEMLQKDDNMFYAAVLTKKTLVNQMMRHIKFNKDEQKALKELFKIWRKPIILDAQRAPIIIGGK